MIAAKRIKIIKGYTEEKLEYEVELFLTSSPYDWTVHKVYVDEGPTACSYRGLVCVLVCYIRIT